MSEWQQPPEWQPQPQYSAQPPPPPPPASHAAPSSKTTAWVVAIVAAFVVGGGGGFLIGHSTASKSKPTTGPSTSAAPSPTGATDISVNGTMQVDGTDNYTSDGAGGCLGASGYDDISEGAEVVISDDTGATLEITHLEAGNDDGTSCTFAFRASIPAGKKFYGVTVTHRGTVKFTEDTVSTASVVIGN